MTTNDDNLDALEDELDLPCVLVVEEHDDGLIVDCPFAPLDDNTRIALLVKALMVELGPTIVEVIDGAELDEDDA